MKICDSTVHVLLGRWLDTEFEPDFLAKVSAETLTTMKHELDDIFEDLELTTDDVKAAWKEWFDWAAHNGTLVSGSFRIVDPECSYKHDELRVIDLVLKLAYEAIDNLP